MSCYPRQPQGTSVTTDHYETIRAATLGAGRNLVSCRQIPFGRVTRRERLRREHGFVVERGSRTTGWTGGAPVRSAAALVLGIPGGPAMAVRAKEHSA